MRVARWVGIGLVVVLGLLVALDRIGNAVAERVAGDTLQRSQHLAARPDVNIGGFPFLTQLASGSYGKITITAHDVPLNPGARPLDLSDLHVVLHDLSVSRNFHTFHAARASADAVVTYSDLGATLGADLSYAGDGRVSATKSLTVAGTTVHGTITARPQLEHGSLSFADASIANAGGFGRDAAAALERVFGVAIPLQGIPFQVRVHQLRATAQGVQVALTGRNLDYSR